MALSQAENGPLDTWPWETLSNDNLAPFMQTYFLPFLKVQKDCAHTTNQDCFAKTTYKFLNGVNFSDINTGSRYKFTLADGSSWAFLVQKTSCITTPAVCADFIIDVNGHKSPNIYGRDLFAISLIPFVNLPAMTGVYGSFDTLKNSWTHKNSNTPPFSYCNPAGSEDYNGSNCGARIQQAGWKMEY